MKIREIGIKNFRGIEDLTLKLDNFTILIGKNGAGKSSILHALNFFKEPNYKLTVEDYYKKDLSRQIEVSIIFYGLSANEKEEFNYYIQNDELKIIKIAVGNEETNDPNVSQRYHGIRLMHRPFNIIRIESRKTEQRGLYNTLRSEQKYLSLPSVRSADQIEEHLIEWETNHSDELELIIDAGQFFGWKGVGTGKLGKFIEFFFIPAVHEYSEEEKAENSTYLNELLNLTIKKTHIETPELSEFKKSAQRDYKEMISCDLESKTSDLSEELSERLNNFAPGCNVFINYQPGDIKFSDTIYGTELEEFGFKGPISFLGHGVQRSFFFTLLQYLGEQRFIDKIQITQTEENSSLESSKFFILLIIEEPELYQHPNRIKLIMKIFQELTSKSTNSLFHFQIICSSHSPHLIDVQNANTIRLLRKVKEGEEFKVLVKEVDLNIIAQKLREMWEFPEEIRSDESTLISRLITIMSPELSEGFFADKVVLVEGFEDKAVLYAIDQQLHENNFDKFGITIIPTLGKRNMDRPALIFKELEIPTYIIFDTDSDKKGDDLESHKKCNIALRKIMGDVDIQDSIEQKIETHWASLDPNLTFIIKNSIEEDYYNQEMNSLKEFYQFHSIKDCRKNYKVMQDFVRKCYEDGKSIPILESIIQQIYNL
ncbi:MAG: ATP-dependent endonuclease [Promethearchaeota archaeon]